MMMIDDKCRLYVVILMVICVHSDTIQNILINIILLYYYYNLRINIYYM